MSLIRQIRRTAGPSGDGALQAGILPWRRGDKGVELLLITSRGGNRWIIPKGWPMPRKSLRQSACQEAFEEAGIRGEADLEPVGSFVTDKTDLLGRTRQLQVIVYGMEVHEELSDWPEKALRQRRWCSGEEAARVVESASLRAMVEAFVQRGCEGA